MKMKAWNDINALKTAERKGLQKGMEQERLNSDKKLEAEKLNLAKNLLDILDDKTIVLKTGLDITTVSNLRNKLTEKSSIEIDLVSICE